MGREIPSFLPPYKLDLEFTITAANGKERDANGTTLMTWKKQPQLWIVHRVVRKNIPKSPFPSRRFGHSVALKLAKKEMAPDKENKKM